MNCPVCNREVKTNGVKMCVHNLDKQYHVVYSFLHSEDGETVVVLYNKMETPIRMPGFHILTVDRIEKLLLLK